MANKKPKRLADLLPPEAFDEAFKQFDEELRHAQAELGTPKNTLAWFLQFAEKDLKKLSPSQRNIEISHLMASALGDKPDSGKGKFTGREEIWDSRDPRYLGALKSAQREIKKALESSFSQSGWLVPQRIVVKSTYDKPTKTNRVDMDFVTPQGLANLALFGLFKAYTKAGNHLRICLRPDCQKPFVATKRQEYCTMNCSQITRNTKKKTIREAKESTRRKKK